MGKNSCISRAAFVGMLDRSRKRLRAPAMAAGIADHIWGLEEIAGLLDPN